MVASSTTAVGMTTGAGADCPDVEGRPHGVVVAQRWRDACGVVETELLTFRYGVDRRYAPVLLLCGFRASRDAVRVGNDLLRVTFGWFHLETPLSNVDGAHITRHYRWWTAPGARLSRVDDGLTFGTNHEAGVCVHFRETVPSSLRKRGHAALTVTVEDLQGLVDALGGAESGS
jgi:hypothetical protein